MLIFIDESGDPGFNIIRGSSSAFVIACICFTSNQDAELTAGVIKAYRKSLGWSNTVEFKFSRTKREIREAFFHVVKSCPFRIHAILFRKDKIYSANLRNNKERFYNFATRNTNTLN